MVDDSKSLRLALLVDAENMQPDHMRQVLPHVFELGMPVVQYAYADFSDQKRKSWTDFLRKNIMEARQITPAQSGKNSADIALVIDAMDLILRDRCDGLCIVSTDQDFAGLATYLKREGRKVFGFGKRETNRKFRQACTKFFEVQEISSENSCVPKSAIVNSNGSASLPSDVSNENTAVECWPRLQQEILKLSPNGAWIPLQRLGAELGKQGLRSSQFGGTKWAKVFEKAAGYTITKDASGHSSIRIGNEAKVA